MIIQKAQQFAPCPRYFASRDRREFASEKSTVEYFTDNPAKQKAMTGLITSWSLEGNASLVERGEKCCGVDNYFPAHIFAWANVFGGIDYSRVGRLFEFGSGSGGPTAVLERIARLHDVELIASELDEANRVSLQQALNSYSRGQIEIGNGLEYLARNSVGEFDLLALNMFHISEPDLHDLEDQPMRRFFGVCAERLSEGGHVLIYTDKYTSSRIFQVVGASNIGARIALSIPEARGTGWVTTDVDGIEEIRAMIIPAKGLAHLKGAAI